MISFGLCVCSYQPTQPSCAEEPWAAIAGFADCVVFLEEDHKRGLAAAPTPGSTVAVKIGYPFLAEIGVPFWCLYHPPGAALDGYIDDYWRDLPDLRLVRARIVDPPTHEAERQAYARADVIELVDPVSLLSLPPTHEPISHIIPRVNFYKPETAQCGPLIYKTSNIEGDIISWTLMRNYNSQSAMLMFGESGQHEDHFFAGHRPLSTEEASALQ